MVKIHEMDSLFNAKDALGRAVLLAITAHAGQYDKAGKPYINHPLEVASYGDDVDSKIVGFLHDVLEDSEFNQFDLREAKIPAHCIEAVRCLTKPHGLKSKRRYMSIDTYLEIISRNPLATKVKIRDYISNTNFERLLLLPEDVRERLMHKYYKQLFWLCQKSLLQQNEKGPWQWYIPGSGVNKILVPDNRSHYIMNMKKFMAKDPINHPDYVLRKSSEFDWGHVLQNVNSQSFKNKEKSMDDIDVLGNYGYIRYLVRSLIESIVKEQGYAYIQVPAFVLNDLAWVKKLGCTVFRVKKYSASAFKLKCIDVIIYKNPASKDDPVPMIVEHFQNEKTKKHFRKEESIKLFRKQK